MEPADPRLALLRPGRLQGRRQTSGTPSWLNKIPPKLVAEAALGPLFCHKPTSGAAPVSARLSLPGPVTRPLP